MSRRLRWLADRTVLTPLGVLVCAAAIGALEVYGKRQQDLVLYVASCGALGLLVISVVSVLLASRWLRRAARRALARAGGPMTLEAEQLRDSGFTLPALVWWPFVKVDWRWQEPDDAAVEQVAQRGRLHERVRFRGRGEYTRTVRRVVVADVFGLTRFGFSVTEARGWTVLPASGRLPGTPLLQAFGSGDLVSHPSGPPEGDLIEMRRYVPGDAMKRMLWKTYARTRHLMVRLPERAEAPTRRTLAYQVSGEDDEAAAALARVALESGALGDDWRFGADGAAEDVARVPDAIRLIVRSRGAPGGEGLGPFFARAADFGAARCVLFVPSAAGAWLERVAAVVQRRRAGVEVVVGCDRGAPVDSGWRRWFYRRARDAGPADPQAIVERLAGAGATVTTIDRRAGRVLGRTAGRGAARHARRA